MSAATAPITRADIEAKFRELQGDVNDVVEERKGTALKVAVGVGVAVVVVAFLLGVRRGRRRTTVVEIRRV